MILHDPFKISARLLPALQIGDGWLSLDPSTCKFFLDLPDGKHVISDFRPGAASNIQACFVAILSFMSAAAESRKYRERTGRQGENEDLFPPNIVDWIVDNDDDIGCLSWELEERTQLIEDQS